MINIYIYNFIFIIIFLFLIFQASVEKNLDKLSALVDSKKFTAHAQAILVSETAVPNISKLSLKDKKVCSFKMSSEVIIVPVI